MEALVKSTLGRFRLVSLVEGVSYILLLFVAVPLKRFAGMPEAVSIVGMTHGVLFILYVLLLVQTTFEYGWKLKFIAIVFVSSLIPFAPFYVDKKMLSRLAH